MTSPSFLDDQYSNSSRQQDSRSNMMMYECFSTIWTLQKSAYMFLKHLAKMIHLINKYFLYLLLGYHTRWSDIPKWSLASRMLHLHTLSKVLGWTKIYVKGWQTLLCGLFWWTFLKALHCLLQTNYRYVSIMRKYLTTIDHHKCQFCQLSLFHCKIGIFEPILKIKLVELASLQ